MSTALDAFFETPKATKYADLTQGGHYDVELSQEQACVVLKCHDRGVKSLDQGEQLLLDQVIAELKDKIWP